MARVEPRHEVFAHMGPANCEVFVDGDVIGLGEAAEEVIDRCGVEHDLRRVDDQVAEEQGPLTGVNGEKRGEKKEKREKKLLQKLLQRKLQPKNKSSIYKNTQKHPIKWDAFFIFTETN